MADLRGFNANEHESMREFDPLPQGRYLAAIVASERKLNSKNAGSHLRLDFEILEGQYQGRHLFAQINLENPNPEAVRIAQIELAQICKCVNVLQPKDSIELHDLPLVLSVAVEKRKDTGEIGNRIKGYQPKAEWQKEAKASAPAGKAPWTR